MPYIKPDVRRDLTKKGYSPMYPGELNFVLARECDAYINEKGISYTTYNEVIGVLECLKLELARRFLFPYEDKKWAENGDVFEHYHAGT